MYSLPKALLLLSDVGNRLENLSPDRPVTEHHQKVPAQLAVPLPVPDEPNSDFKALELALLPVVLLMEGVDSELQHVVRADSDLRARAEQGHFLNENLAGKLYAEILRNPFHLAEIVSIAVEGGIFEKLRLIGPIRLEGDGDVPALEVELGID